MSETMTESKHTPGPWRVTPDLDGVETIVSDMTERGGVPGRVGQAIMPADARLIAAAPDMLAALESVMDDLRHYVATHGAGPDKRLAQALAAVKAARGEA